MTESKVQLLKNNQIQAKKKIEKNTTETQVNEFRQN